MKYYFVICHQEDTYVIEDLSNSRKISVNKSGNKLIDASCHKEATIEKILPNNFRLSPFSNPEDRYLFRIGDNYLLYNLSDSTIGYSGEDIVDNSIIGLEDWEIPQ